MPSIRLLAIVLVLRPSAETGDAVPWKPELVREAARWGADGRDPSIAGVEKGLKVSVPPGATWRIAAIDRILLPDRAGGIRVRIAEVGGTARWLVRLYGDLRGTGPRTAGLFQDEREAGEVEIAVDPRLVPSGRTPVQVQLGLEGAPGDHVVFESLEFLPGPDLPARAARQPGQLDIATVELMPAIPRPLKIKDWRAVARDYDGLAFDLEARGQYLPLIWIDESRVNIDRPAFGLPSYAGDPARTSGPNHEGITCMGAVLGATVAGIDKRAGRHDWVLMAEAYHNKKDGENLVLNGVRTRTGGSFWYEIWPHVVFYALADRYPGAGGLDAIVRSTADRWRDACRALAGKDGIPDFDHTAFRFETMEAVDNGRWKEPDAAAGVAWLEYAAWMRFGDPRHLEAAEGCLRFLEERKGNPYYEVLLPYGALTAARANAELGRRYDVPKLLDWCFGISDCRGGWGVMASRWGGCDCHGLVGSIDDRGGYAFAMNTFAQAGALVPLVRYDKRFARAIGKWILHLASAARLFYPGELPPGHESSAGWTGDPKGVVAYEGLRQRWGEKSPYATGDPVVMKWGPPTDRGLYGSGYVGLLGGIVRPTEDEAILALDCLATDFCRRPAHPTFLYYNPHPEPRKVRVDAGDSPRDLYDACSGTFLARGARGATAFAVPASGAVLLVLAPAGGKETREGGKLLVDGAVIDYALEGKAETK
jgi:hypothetical protein